MATKSKKAKSGKKDKSAKLSKKQKRNAEREAKRAARKGDGSFPDILVVTKEKDKEGGKSWFLGHSEELETIYKSGVAVGVYKLRKVSTVEIKRKVVR